MTIQYYTKNVYGQTRNYLVLEEAGKDQPAAAILYLIGQTTISNIQMAKFQLLGITFERVFEPNN